MKKQNASQAMFSQRYSERLNRMNISDSRGGNRKKSRLFDLVITDLKKRENRMKKRTETEGGNFEQYVDAHRAIGVAIGTQDIKRQFKGKHKLAEAMEQVAEAQKDVIWGMYYKFAIQQMSQRNYSGALEYLLSAAELDTENIKVLNACCECYIKLGQPKEALIAASEVKVTKKNPITYKAALYTARSHFELGNFEHAAVWYYRYSRLRTRFDMKAEIARCHLAIENAVGGECFSFPQANECIWTIQRDLRKGLNPYYTSDSSKVMQLQRQTKLTWKDIAKKGSVAATAALLFKGTTPSWQHQALLTTSGKKGKKEQKKTGKKSSTVAGEARRLKKLSRELDMVIRTSDIGTEKRFVQELLKSQALKGLKGYKEILKDASSYIDNRTEFWSQHESKLNTKSEPGCRTYRLNFENIQ